MENQRDRRPPGDSPGVVASSLWEDPPDPPTPPPPPPLDGMVQALALRKIMLLVALLFSVVDDPGPDADVDADAEPVALPVAAVRHLSNDKCCLALLKVERNCELRWLPALSELTLLLVCSSSVSTSSSSLAPPCSSLSRSLSRSRFLSRSRQGDLVSRSLLLPQLLLLPTPTPTAAWPPLALKLPPAIVAAVQPAPSRCSR